MFLAPHCLNVLFVCVFAEKAREYLHKTGRFIVIGGIISPVHDSYGKPVSHEEESSLFPNSQQVC